MIFLKKSRDISYDFLRAIAIIMIFLAHSNPPGVIFQLRNFDVVLLVIIFGIFSNILYNKEKNYLKYIKKRIFRIIVPVWSFLIIFYVFRLLIFKTLGNIGDVIDSFVFGEKFGYVWIFRVYILTSLIVPLFSHLKEKLSLKKYIMFLLCVYVIYETLIFIIGKNNMLLNSIVFYTIGYGICCGIGVILDKISNKSLFKISILLLIVFAFFVLYYFKLNGILITTNQFKYPPQLYYLSYALAISFILFIIIVRKKIFITKNTKFLNVLSFIGTHSMWIYLWHILFVKVINYIIKDLNWLLYFTILIVLSLLVTYIQSMLIKKINKKKLLVYFDC